MKAKEIRNEAPGAEVEQSAWLQEIAAQLAELNERLEHFEKLAIIISRLDQDYLRRKGAL